MKRFQKLLTFNAFRTCAEEYAIIMQILLKTFKNEIAPKKLKWNENKEKGFFPNGLIQNFEKKINYFFNSNYYNSYFI